MNFQLAKKIIQSNMDDCTKKQVKALIDKEQELLSQGYRDIDYDEQFGWRAIPTLESHKDWTEKDGKYFINGIPVQGYDPVAYENRIPGFWTVRQPRPDKDRPWLSLVCGFDLLKNDRIAVLAQEVENWEIAMEKIEKHKDYDTPICFTIEEPISIDV